MFNEKSIFITGGTGSFGRLFVKTILERYQPKCVIVYSRDELKQYEMSQSVNQDCVRYVIGDVRDQNRLIETMRGVDYVVHAAALKQVPASEYNPMECIKTNVNGSENVIQAAIANNVKQVMALSTDKAANPINLYGATKLASDKLMVAANNISGCHKTRFAVVRYGNVVGSRGSVVPFFNTCIEEGRDHLPITDVRMTRFWITLQQGVEFVLQGFRRMHGGEIFVPKIPTVKIVDLASAMAPHLTQKVIGIRPGEKLHETMCPADDSHLTLEFSEHFVIKPTIQFREPMDFSVDKLGDKGSLVDQSFEYSSGKNPDFLDVDGIITLNYFNK
jgi:UDP-N-acetylglucosamine 4,6-dehydratase/5-epimerase